MTLPVPGELALTGHQDSEWGVMANDLGLENEHQPVVLTLASDFTAKGTSAELR